MEATFPRHFWMGAATAAHQIEGNNTNSDVWAAEHAPGTPFTEPSGDACDSYHRYREDISLLADAGLDMYRFGVEWGRVEPEEGYFSRAELDHYRRMAAFCLERGVTPMITYQHFTAPRWFSRRGGWRGQDSADLFARYCERVSEHIGDLAPWACTINEANLRAMFQVIRAAPVADREDSAGLLEEQPEVPKTPLMGGFPSSRVEVMAAVHRKAVEAIKGARPEIQVGWSLALPYYVPDPGGQDLWEKALRITQLDWIEVSRDDDFIGVQTYTRDRIGPQGLAPVPEGLPVTQMGWEVYPQALEHTVRLAAEHCGRPVIVTENGIATEDDSSRIAYIEEALAALRRCLDDGVEVGGYLYWSLLDNFEWTSGYRPTFGLIAVDRSTFVRTPKESLTFLGQVAGRRG